MLLRDPTQDWALCGDGVTRNIGAVKGAVKEFAAARGLYVQATQQTWPSFYMRKP